MPTFVYQARDQAGQPVTGTVEASSAGEASFALRREGKFPISVRPTHHAAAESVNSNAPRLPRTQLIQLSTQLAIMLETGVTLVDALECIARQTDHPALRTVVQNLSEQVQSGSDFSTALQRHPHSFPRLYVALVKASEKSGMLPRLLQRATNYLRDEQEIRKKVKGAMTYPLIMLAFAVVTTLFLLAFVLPRFASIYSNKGAALPVPTRILLGLSDFVVTNWLALLTGSVVVLVTGWIFLGSAYGRRLWHEWQLRIPLLGKMFRQLHLARSLRMIGTMAGAGVSLLDSVATAHDLCENTRFQRLWHGVSEQLQRGKQMSEPLMDEPFLVPRGIAQMIQSGEASGKLASVSEQVATFAEQELKEKITELTRYIEPIMIVAMGLLIGGVALALMLPVFTISRVVAH
jgi:type IV pilus assembly protein PilC